MPVRLYVGNLPFDVTEPELREFFSPAGPLSSVIIPVDRETGKRRGFAFIEFGDPAHAAEAIRRFNNQPLRERLLVINEARARESRPDSPGGPRFGTAGRPAAGSGPRSSFGRPDFSPSPMRDRSSGRPERRARGFGPGAKPGRRRKPHRESGDEMGGRRGPIRERTGGQIFGHYDDADYGDDPELESSHDIEDQEENDTQD